MQIYLKNNAAKFHPDPIWNDGALGFFERGRPNNKNNDWICLLTNLFTRWLEIWGQLN